MDKSFILIKMVIIIIKDLELRFLLCILKSNTCFLYMDYNTIRVKKKVLVKYNLIV
ncbi:MAG: hypothetical protein ACJAWW_001486 [Sulfurimonas sp.]|jgi:hypothetical protein